MPNIKLKFQKVHHVQNNFTDVGNVMSNVKLLVQKVNNLPVFRRVHCIGSTNLCFCCEEYKYSVF